MESINECFLLEKELRGVVQKGMRGNVGAVEYLEEVSGMSRSRSNYSTRSLLQSAIHGARSETK